MSESVKSKILWVIIGAVITSMLGLNAYYQKGTNEATKKNTDTMIELSETITEFKTEQKKDNDFMIYRLSEHDNALIDHEKRIDCVETKLLITQNNNES